MARELPTLAKAFPPGDFLREEMEFRGWTQQQLADRMGRPFQTVNAIINGRKQITAETALQLEEAFKIKATYWMNLETTWQLYTLSQKKKAGGAKRKRTSEPFSFDLPLPKKKKNTGVKRKRTAAAGSSSQGQPIYRPRPKAAAVSVSAVGIAAMAGKGVPKKGSK